MTLRRLASLLLLASTSCAGVLTKADNVVVGDSLAARIYYEDKKARLCPHDDVAFLPTAPAGCTAFGQMLEEWLHDNGIASDVIDKGALPPEERALLQSYTKKAAKLP